MESTILGISCDYHDAAAALIIDGVVVAAAEQERFSRVKHDASPPVDAVASCLQIAGIGPDDVDLVAFYEKPLNLVSRYLTAKQRQGPRGMPAFVRDAPRLLNQNLMVGHRLDDLLRSIGGTRTVPVRYLDHHLSHAAAAFLPSPFEHAAILTVDGIGEWATASVGRGTQHRVELIEELRFPDSLGLLYSFITAYCGFRPNADEYKVMGLAPYGTPRYLDALSELADVADDGSLGVRANRMRWYQPSGLRRRSLHQALGGPPRTADGELGEREADLAASIQQLTESAMLKMAAHARDLTGEPNLAMAGGVALNCVANGRLVRESGFEQIWIQPAAGDAGSAIGVALALWHDTLGHHREPQQPDAMAGAFLGPRVLPDEVDSWVATEAFATTAFDDADSLADDVAARLAAGQVVGWFQGRMEFGPRALGHRSILADPRNPEVRHRLNTAIKGREDFRPFAPAVLAEHAAEWFDLHVASPYMLVVAQVADEHRTPVEHEPADIDERANLGRSTIPAVTHVDGSARVQTVDAATNPELHRLLTAFHRLTGCPVLVNTSFNLAEEPIVATPDQAVRTARAGGLDALVIEHHVFDGGALRDGAP